MDEFKSQFGENEDMTGDRTVPYGQASNEDLSRCAKESEAVASEGIWETGNQTDPLKEAAETAAENGEPVTETVNQTYDDPYAGHQTFVPQSYDPNGRYDDRPVYAGYETAPAGSQTDGEADGQTAKGQSGPAPDNQADFRQSGGSYTQNSYWDGARMGTAPASGSAWTESDQSANTQNAYGGKARTGDERSFGSSYNQNAFGGNAGRGQTYNTGSAQFGTSYSRAPYGGQDKESDYGQGIYGGRASGQKAGDTRTSDDGQPGLYGGMPKGADGRKRNGADASARYDSYRFNDPDGLNNLDGTPGRTPKKTSNIWRIVAIVAIAIIFIGCVSAVGYTGYRVFTQKSAGSADKNEGRSEALPTPEVHLGNQDEETKSGEARVEDGAKEDEADTSRAAENVGKASYSGEELTVVEVVELCMPSMVAITNTSVTEYQNMFGETRSYEDVSAGSGIIVGETDTELLIATNNHVITGAKDITVTFVDDEAVSGTIKGTDVENDLAIVAVETKSMSEDTLKAIRIINIGNSEECVVGEGVVAIGNALGYGQTVTYGIISALNREVTVDGSKHVLLQTDASINPGNSGGALINMRGELIGINEVKYADTSVEGFGYAIPMATAEPILTELGSKVAREKVVGENASYIGISCKTVPNYYTQMGYPAGVYVSTVDEGGPAEEAGIVAGDIITSIDGAAVTSTEDLIEQLTYYAAGETIKFRIRRMNEEQTAFETEDIMVTLGKRTDADLFKNTEPT